LSDHPARKTVQWSAILQVRDQPNSFLGGSMNVQKTLCSLVLSAGFLMPMSAMAADKHAKDYQVTGPVLAYDKDAGIVTIQKGDDKWEIEITSDTKIEGTLKVGDKVTIHYHMVAKSVDEPDAKKK
jgi:hypothetical protein